MLYDFLTTHRADLIRRCEERASERHAPADVALLVEHGVPLFLEQLIRTLEDEGLTSARTVHMPPASPVDSDIGRAATLRGAELLRLGYSIDQVVHCYGDVCQTVTELAVEHNETITPDEFRTLNRCLDEAIADAVTAFGDERETAILDQAADLHRRLGALAEEQTRLLDIALQTFEVIKSGNVGVRGATGTALVNTLKELRALIDHSLPEIRLMSGMTTTVKRTAPPGESVARHGGRDLSALPPVEPLQ